MFVKNVTVKHMFGVAKIQILSKKQIFWEE